MTQSPDIGLEKFGVGLANLRRINSWFGYKPYLRATADMLIPGCLVSSTMAFIPSGDHRRQRCTDAMISAGPVDVFFSGCRVLKKRMWFGWSITGRDKKIITMYWKE
ncbi:MAG: hypothetical protein NTW71_14110 [Deltaproteobacteria bacterium]|nr:hypothetical protein [Deltaproteobacteria bacterium]